MKWGNKQYSSLNYIRKAKKKGYKAQLKYNSTYEHFYFLIEKENYTFNSLWVNLKYKTEEECMLGCEKYIDLLIKDDMRKE